MISLFPSGWSAKLIGELIAAGDDPYPTVDLLNAVPEQGQKRGLERVLIEEDGVDADNAPIHFQLSMKKLQLEALEAEYRMVSEQARRAKQQNEIEAFESLERECSELNRRRLALIKELQQYKMLAREQRVEHNY